MFLSQKVKNLNFPLDLCGYDTNIKGSEKLESQFFRTLFYQVIKLLLFVIENDSASYEHRHDGGCVENAK